MFSTKVEISRYHLRTDREISNIEVRTIDSDDHAKADENRSREYISFYSEFSTFKIKALL